MASYNKGSKETYNKGEQRKSIPLNLIILIVLAGLLYFGYSYKDEILNKIKEWGVVLIEKKHPKPAEEVIFVVEDSATDIIDGSHDIQIAFVEAVEPIEEPTENDDVIAKTTTTISVTDKPAVEPNNTIQSKKTENFSKHKLEVFVDQITGKYGIEDLTTKKILIQAEYRKIKKIRNGVAMPFAIAQRNELWGVIDMLGNEITPFEFEEIYETRHTSVISHLTLSKNVGNRETVHGIVRIPDAKIVIPPVYTTLTSIYSDYSAFLAKEDRNGLYGIVDTYNKLIVPFEYDWIQQTSVKGYMKLHFKKYNNPANKSKYTILYGLVQLSNGKIIIPVEYEYLEVIGPISFIAVAKDGLYGCVNNRNEVVVPLIHSSGIGTSTSHNNPSNNKVYLTLPNGERAAYNTQGKRVPSD